MIYETSGDILESRCEALVNPVNCAGVAGKGLALQFKKRFPDMHARYVLAHQHGMLRPGVMFSGHDDGKLIVCFPTKRHWRDKSLLGDIRAGLGSLLSMLERTNIVSVAIPALGCGLGGLEWPSVRTVIEEELGGWPNIVELYPPQVP